MKREREAERRITAAQLRQAEQEEDENFKELYTISNRYLHRHTHITDCYKLYVEQREKRVKEGKKREWQAKLLKKREANQKKREAKKGRKLQKGKTIDLTKD